MMDVIVNGRSYRMPQRPTVVICFDGCDPAYIERGVAAGILPTISSFQRQGFYAIAQSVIPSFTNPNNASIVTGVPPVVHGISGNYYLHRDTGEERMITDASLMRCGTILAAMADAGLATAAVTAKDKLRLMLARGLKGINFSSEHADRATEAANGIGGEPDAARRGGRARWGGGGAALRDAAGAGGRLCGAGRCRHRHRRHPRRARLVGPRRPPSALARRHADDDFIRTLGKAAIIEAIAFKERKSKLYGDKGGSISGRSEIDDTWYWTFVKMLLEGSPPREAAEEERPRPMKTDLFLPDDTGEDGRADH
jgi:hypothetical protein